MSDVCDRNAKAVSVALTRMDADLRESRQRVDGLLNTVSTLAGRVNDLEREIQMLRIASFGHGATG